MRFTHYMQLSEQDESIFKARRMEGRKEKYIQMQLQHLNDYVKNPSGPLNLKNTPITHLPAGLTRANFLDLDDSAIEYLPDNFWVSGYLSINRTKIKELPKNLSIDGALFANETYITTLPADLTVKESIILNRLKSEFTFPPNFPVTGDLKFDETKVISLPDDLFVRGELVISPQTLKILPKTTKCVELHVMTWGTGMHDQVKRFLKSNEYPGISNILLNLDERIK